ncbi:hypothetical protein [Enterococcus sp. AZ192]|uniref:hypothetical protein n=1 Tax=unclassified Enterococcus TaxID=2608891 RepID=UPI003D28991E
MANIASDIGAAAGAVAGVSAVSISGGQQVTLSRSNINSMTQGAEISNQLISNLSQLIECVKEQSQTFPKIAEIIAIEDSKIKF